MTDFRAELQLLFAELQLLFDVIDSKAVLVLGHNSRLVKSMDRARAALAAEPEGPSDAELIQLACNEENAITFARAVLARWGNQS